jgi:hypothetical protein
MLFPPALDTRKAHAGERDMMTALSLSPAATAALVPDDATIMIGGFMGVGSILIECEPHHVLFAGLYLDVIDCDSGKRYRIRYGSATNVRETDGDGRSIMGWCFVPTGNLVVGDVVLAQKIALKTNETGALAVANRFPVQMFAEARRGRIVAVGNSP